MSAVLKQIDQDQWVWLSYEGEVPLAEAACAREQVAALLKEKGWRKVLVDTIGVVSVWNETQLFELGRSLSQFLPRGTWLAVVVRPDQDRHARVAEKGARTRGVFLTFFLDPEKAKAWLRRDPRSGTGSFKGRKRRDAR